MTRRHSPLQQLKEAKQIAKDHGLFVVERSGSYLLYREQTPHNVYVGSRRSPESLRAFVCKVTNFH